MISNPTFQTSVFRHSQQPMLDMKMPDISFQTFSTAHAWHEDAHVYRHEKWVIVLVHIVNPHDPPRNLSPIQIMCSTWQLAKQKKLGLDSILSIKTASKNKQIRIRKKIPHSPGKQARNILLLSGIIPLVVLKLKFFL